MECPICFEVIKNSCYANCNHHFCYNCLMKWCRKGGKRCPMCKNRMFQIILDKEFDLKNNPLCKEKIERESTKIINVNFKDKVRPGIGIIEREKLVKNEKNHGVVVLRLEKKKKLINYLKLNDVIMYLNGMPCVKAIDSIEIIEKYFKEKDTLKIELLDERNKTELHCWDFFSKMKILDFN